MNQEKHIRSGCWKSVEFCLGPHDHANTIALMYYEWTRVSSGAGQNGTPDGLRVDVDGNLWIGWGMGTEGLDGVSIFNPEGKPIGRIDLPERCANLCFGSRQRNRLFMCGSTSMFSLYVNTQGVAGG